MNHAERKSKEKILVVEFVGVPGSGKTALAARLSDCLRDMGFERTETIGGRRSNESRLRYHVRAATNVFRVALVDVGFVVKSIRRIAETRQRSKREWLSVTWNWLSKTGAMLRAARRAGGIRVLDEGIFHAAWSINYSAQLRPLCAGTLSHACNLADGVDWLVIYVRAESNVIAARLESRSDGRHRLSRDIRQNSSGSARRAEMAMAAVCSVLTECTERGWIRGTLSVDNGGVNSLDAVAGDVRRFIMDRSCEV